jgi:flagellum-specific peptidoglycan hydrolase FlgJ
MTPKQFKQTYLQFALASEAKTKVPVLFTLAQAAIESGYGQFVKGNNFFGIKADKNYTGPKQEFMTSEYNNGVKVKVMQWFRLYSTPEESFTDHGNFLRANKRYRLAFNYTEPILFASYIAAAGYATDPKYFDKISSIIGTLGKV